MNHREEVLLNKSEPNDVGAIIGAVQRFGDVGGAANLAEKLISRSGWSVDLAHPGFVSRRKQNPDMSDYTDGLSQKQPPLWRP